MPPLHRQSPSQSETTSTNTTCWTCRLRKKKCPGSDLTGSDPQACKACISLKIPCHGFTPSTSSGGGGTAKAPTPTPSWIDGTSAADKRERALKMEEIRAGVKRTTEGLRRERALRGLRRRRKKEKNGGQEKDVAAEMETEEEQDLGSGMRNGSSSSPIQEAMRSGTAMTSGMYTSETLLTIQPHPQLEPVLLMHYLDRIFPLQFPFYEAPPAGDGGRGWLLALLRQTRPLYDAALSLAAWHLNSTRRRDGRGGRERSGDAGDEARRKRQEREEVEHEQLLYARAITGLRERIEVLSRKGADEGLKDGIEVLACIVQLILLEVSKGDMENWRKHLLAAPDLHLFLRTYCKPHHLLLRRSTFSEDCFGPGREATSFTFVDHAAMEFFSSVIIWFDILGSASTGLRPQYADICAAALGDADSKVQLQNLMGCENWAMTIIRDIAVLEDWKRNMISADLLSFRELVRRADDILQRLEISIARLSERSPQVSNLYAAYLDSDSRRRAKDLAIARVTQVFASAAQVYLHVVVSGPNPNLPEMRHSVARTLAALRALPSIELIRSVTWPFCIAGCMAACDEEQKFRDLASLANINEFTFGTSRKAMEVMEVCWALRKSSDTVQKDYEWFTTMKQLGIHVLLV